MIGSPFRIYSEIDQILEGKCPSGITLRVNFGPAAGMLRRTHLGVRPRILRDSSSGSNLGQSRVPGSPADPQYMTGFAGHIDVPDITSVKVRLWGVP